MIYEDADVLVFLNRYPTLRGYTLVCPRRHVERVIGELSEDEYLELQRWVYRVGRALQQVVPTERLYVLSLGSQQGNRHVHWHLAPLPPGVPYQEQQLAALSMRRGILAASCGHWACIASVGEAGGLAAAPLDRRPSSSYLQSAYRCIIEATLLEQRR
jgi:diadenosine tetraphosphate (Ap4A) HIT family hydrolase